MKSFEIDINFLFKTLIFFLKKIKKFCNDWNKTFYYLIQ
jgi:hypothetical protein